MSAPEPEPLFRPDTHPAIHDGSAVDYVLRTAQQETMAVSALADQKANILLGVSLIMTTAVVGLLPSTGVTFGLMVLGTSTVVAAILALLSLLPSISSLSANGSAPNPLYFAHVAQMPLEEFRSRMGAMLATNPSIYEGIIEDLHAASTVVFNRKYRYLRAAYVAFLTGLLLTVIAVLIDIAVGNI